MFSCEIHVKHFSCDIPAKILIWISRKKFFKWNSCEYSNMNVIESPLTWNSLEIYVNFKWKVYANFPWIHLKFTRGTFTQQLVNKSDYTGGRSLHRYSFFLKSIPREVWFLYRESDTNSQLFRVWFFGFFFWRMSWIGLLGFDLLVCFPE